MCVLAVPVAAQRDTTARDSVTRRRGALPPVVVTGTLTPNSAQSLGIARATVSRAALESEPSREAVDPLRHVTGVHIDEANGPLGPTIIRIRGGEEQFTQILVDGIAINENGGFFDWQGVTLLNTDRVEVARGPQSTVYGTSAMSGAVQIVSRAGVPGPMRSEATLEGARTSPFGGSRHLTLESSGGSDALRYSAGLGAAYERGVFALPNDLRANDASTRLDYAPAEHLLITNVARYSGTESKLPVRDPGVTRAPLDPNQRQGRNRFIDALTATWTPSARWTNQLTVADYHLVFTYDDTHDQVDTTKFKVGFFNANYHYHAVLERTTARYVGTVAGPSSNDVAMSASFGGEWEREALRYDASGDFGPSALSMSRPSLAAFAEGHVQLGERLSILAGGRAQSFRGVGSAFVPRVTSVITLVPNRLSLRAAAAGAYKAPNIQDEFPDPGFFTGNPDLKPETSRSGEVGLDFTDAKATSSITLFHQRYDDFIRIVPFNGKAQNRNVGRTSASGLELEAAVHPMPRWTISAEGAWTSTEVNDNSGLQGILYPVGEPLPFRPAYTASGVVAFPASALSMSLRLSAVGRQTVLSNRFGGTRVSVAPYNVFGATATYPLSAAFETYVYAENTFNAAYETAFDKPGAPRSIALGVRVRQ